MAHYHWSHYKKGPLKGNTTFLNQVLQEKAFWRHNETGNSLTEQRAMTPIMHLVKRSAALTAYQRQKQALPTLGRAMVTTAARKEYLRPVMTPPVKTWIARKQFLKQTVPEATQATSDRAAAGPAKVKVDEPASCAPVKHEAPGHCAPANSR